MKAWPHGPTPAHDPRHGPRRPYGVVCLGCLTHRLQLIVTAAVATGANTAICGWRLPHPRETLPRPIAPRYPLVRECPASAGRRGRDRPPAPPVLARGGHGGERGSPPDSARRRPTTSNQRHVRASSQLLPDQAPRAGATRRWAGALPRAAALASASTARRRSSSRGTLAHS